MRNFVKIISLILVSLLLFSLPSCIGKEGNASVDDPSDNTTEAVTDEAPFDASVYTYTPSLKDESEMEFGVIIADGVIVEMKKYVAEAPQFSEAGALRYLGDAKKAHAAIDGYYDYQIIKYDGDKLPVVRYSEDLTIKISNDMRVTGMYYYYIEGFDSSGNPIGEKFDKMPERKGEYYLVVNASHNGEYGNFKMQYLAKIING